MRNYSDCLYTGARAVVATRLHRSGLEPFPPPSIHFRTILYLHLLLGIEPTLHVRTNYVLCSLTQRRPTELHRTSASSGEACGQQSKKLGYGRKEKVYKEE